MNDWLTNQTRSLTKVFRSRERNKYNDEYQALAEAHRDWLAARNYFEHVTDPDLVDFAILSLQAAEKRYEYLWKKMKENGY
ncbi:MAG: DUF2508 family protein [Syntrophaceticus sp.]|jgi:hypothetical protein